MSELPIRAAEVEPRAVRWLWRDRVPRGEITVVGGRPDQGKGLFVTHLAADVSRQGGRVLYSAIEDTAATMTRPRLDASGAELENILLWRFALPQLQQQLESIIVNEGIDLVVMDPFAAHLSGNVSRFSDTIRRVLTPLTEFIEQTDTAIVITDHALKRVSANAHPIAALGGSSSGLMAVARMAYLFGMDPDDADKRILAPVKHNLREEPKALQFEVDVEELPIVGEMASLICQKEIDFDARMLVQGPPGKVGRSPDRHASACEWLTNYLADAGKPVKSGTVIEDAKQHGLASRTLRRAADSMKVIRSAAGGRNCTWDLSPEVKQAMGIKVAHDDAHRQLDGQFGKDVVLTDPDVGYHRQAALEALKVSEEAIAASDAGTAAIEKTLANDAKALEAALENVLDKNPEGK